MPIPAESREQLWATYCELGLMERHLGAQQTRYRALASTWLLAALGAMGFVLSERFKGQIPDLMVIGLIGFASSLGICLLWAIDLLVYQRLLDGAYIEGRSLEAAQPWLPQVRNNVRHLLGGAGLALIGWYYIVIVVFLAAVGGAGMLMSTAGFIPWSGIGLAGAAYALLLVVVARKMRSRASRTSMYERDLFAQRLKAYSERLGRGSQR